MSAQNYCPAGFVYPSNLSCWCESGKLYQDCHRADYLSRHEFIQKMRRGEVPFFARVVSENGEQSSMEIGAVRICRDGETQILSEGPITLTTNAVSGDRTPVAIARIDIPADGSVGTIRTAGNASVSNATMALPLALRNSTDGVVMTDSPSGAYVRATLGFQDATQTPYFDFMLGVKGKKEEIVDGRKNRTHVTLFPDGNGKFLRLEGDDTSIEIEQDFYADSKMIIPRIVKIRSSYFSRTLAAEFEVLVAEFEVAGGAIELANIYFELQDRSA